MERNQAVTSARGADGRGGTCGTRRWRGVDRGGGAGDRRDEAILRLTAQGLSRWTIAKTLSVTAAAVVRAQRAGGAS